MNSGQGWEFGGRRAFGGQGGELEGIGKVGGCLGCWSVKCYLQ